MGNAESQLLKQGASEQLKADFAALIESTTLRGDRKYPLFPILENLSKFLTLQQTNRHKDLALYELVHFYYALSQLTEFNTVEEILLVPQKFGKTFFKNCFKQTEAKNLKVGEEGVSVIVENRVFHLRYGRMTFLSALYDFLCAMDGFLYFQNIQEILHEIKGINAINEKQIKGATSHLSALLRKYRNQHLGLHQGDGRFLQLFRFLQEKNDENEIILRDDDVLSFWSLHNMDGDFKGYKTVFNLCCDFIEAFEEVKHRAHSGSAYSLGLDHEQGEVDVSDDLNLSDFIEEWIDPFEVLDQPMFEDVNFFKKKAEREPIEKMMHYGRHSLKLPLAFLRFHIFGKIQSAITTDLQVNRSKDHVMRRLKCEDAQKYDVYAQQLLSVLNHIKELEQACFYVMVYHDDCQDMTVVSEKILSLEKAFKAIKRKGFQDVETSDPELFKDAIRALGDMERQLARYLHLFEEGGYVHLFEKDKRHFSNAFHTIYQGVLQ